MNNKNRKQENLCVNLEYDEKQTIPLALHEMHMARADRRLFWERIVWATVCAIMAIAFVWLWNQYDYESSPELSGVYCLVDSQGNVISSDLEPDDVTRILQELNDGRSQKEENP